MKETTHGRSTVVDLIKWYAKTDHRCVVDISESGTTKHECQEEVALNLPCATWEPRIGKMKINATESLKKVPCFERVVTL